MEVKPAEMARMAGVSRASISGKIKNKTLIINAAGLLDTENPVNARYISKHRQETESAAAADYINNAGTPQGGARPFTPGGAAPGAPLDDFQISQLAGGVPRELLRLPLRELVLRYPGLDKIERYAKILKDLTAAAATDQKIQERSLETIEKNFVVSNLFSFIDILTKQLLDFPESIVDQQIAIVQAQGEASRNDIILNMRTGLGRVIAGAKEQIINDLNNLKSKYQNDNKQNEKFEELKQAIAEGKDE